MVLNRYRAALRAPGVRRLLVTSLVARAPNGMSALSILLLVTRHHGYGRAGLVTGLYVAAAGVSNPLLSRAVDRVGVRRVLVPTGAGYAAAMLALALAPAGSYWAEVGIAAAAGLSNPPVVSVVRGVWPRLLSDDVAQAVYGLEATAQELIFIVGPALVALLAGLASAPVAVAVTGGLGLAGTLAFAAAPVFAGRAAASGRGRTRPLRSSRLVLYVVIGAALTIAFNMTDVGVVAFVSGRHASAASGVVLAVWSLGSMLGGLRFGTGTRPVDDTGVARATVLVAIGVAAASLAPGRVALAAILFVGGATIAPALGRLYARVGASAPEGAATEAFAWVSVGLLAGSSIGSALGGITVDALGARADLALAAVVPAAVGLALLGWFERSDVPARVPVAS